MNKAEKCMKLTKKCHILNWNGQTSYHYSSIVLLSIIEVKYTFSVKSQHSKKFAWPLFLCFRTLFVDFTKIFRLKGPKTKAMRTFKNVVIWQKSISNRGVCHCAIFSIFRALYPASKTKGNWLGVLTTN